MDDYSGPTPLRMRCRIGFAVTGLIVGIAVFICFIAVEQFYNLHIALWGLASGLFAFLTLTVHIQHMRGQRDLWVYRLKFFIVLGFFVQLGSLIALVTYVVLGAVRGQDLMPVNGNDKGFYLAAVWVFMTWKWSFALFIYSRSYRKGYVTSDGSSGLSCDGTEPTTPTPAPTTPTPAPTTPTPEPTTPTPEPTTPTPAPTTPPPPPPTTPPPPPPTTQTPEPTTPAPTTPVTDTTCLNGMNCVNGRCLSGSCLCDEGFEGDYCESDINECRDDPCGSNGICVNLRASFACQCKDGFTGLRCTTGTNEPTTTGPLIPIWWIVIIAVIALLIVILLFIVACTCNLSSPPTDKEPLA